MSDLQKQLDEVAAAAKDRIPAEALSVMGKATEDLKGSGIENIALKDGETAPDFSLANHLNEGVTLTNLLKDGPVVVSFYRGGW